jgi:hypothetical protein
MDCGVVTTGCEDDFTAHGVISRASELQEGRAPATIEVRSRVQQNDAKAMKIITSTSAAEQRCAQERC